MSQMKERMMTTVMYRTLAYPTLTDTQINEAAEEATKIYFEALTEQGRVFDHAELSLMIDIHITAVETKLFVEANQVTTTACYFTHAHTRRWCGNENCRES